MARIDYMSDEDGDLLWADGDLVLGESDEDHIQEIMLLSKGADSEFLTLGLDIIRSYKGKSSNYLVRFERDLKAELAKDGYRGLQVIFNGNNLEDFVIKTP